MPAISTGLAIGLGAIASAGIGAGASLAASGAQAGAAKSAAGLQFQLGEDQLAFNRQQYATSQLELPASTRFLACLKLLVRDCLRRSRERSRHLLLIKRVRLPAISSWLEQEP